MSEKILLVRHMQERCEDRVAAHLQRRGFQLQWCHPFEGDALPGKSADYAAAVVYGGVQSVNEAERLDFIRAELDWIQNWVADDRPYLGLCLGAQLLARALGGGVGPHPSGLHEIGFVPVRATPAGEAYFPAALHVFQWHYEGFTVPAGGELLASGETFPNQAFRAASRAFGLQFHPEATAQMRNDWLQASADALNAPGAHGRARQEQDAGLFEQPMEDWLLGFIDAHLLSTS